ncbi:MAG: class I tRNA ligase family protein [Candidatus Paceibacterota bacterium]
MDNPDLNNKSARAQKEEEILKFWQEKEIFKKSLDKEAPAGEYVFYDGPPFATGTPHYGHILAGTMKDLVGRYKTMRGFHVPRRWGWDCHGLPVENIVEKELNLKSKKDIEEYGVEKFNDQARKSVMTYVDDWKQIVPRLGRFVDMENDYKTMDPSFTETVWWIFDRLNEKGFVYEGFKSMHLCPRCETTLSNFEVNQGYKDITDISVTVKFALKAETGTYFLAWTTTPWTLPGNVALAVNPEIDYVKIKVMSAPEKYILAKSRLSVIKEDYAIIEEFKGNKLIGQEYKPVFDYYNNNKTKNIENGFKVYGANFVTTEDGTGIVHIAPAFGEDDMILGKENNLPFVQHVGTNGKFKPEVTDFAGQDVKPKDDHQKADVEVIKYLAGKGTLFAKEKLIHSYPHCWRCDTPLLNYASSSWFVEVTKFKNDLVKANQKINWVPGDIKDGRFGKWLEGARDWAISRSRYWGAPLPVWRCEKCGEKEFVGSVEDIKKKTGGRNNLFVVRHGEADNNVLGVISSDPKRPHHLTEVGKKQVAETAEKLKDKKIDLIYVSPFVRTQESAKIIADILDLSSDKIITDDRLHEVYGGELDGKSDAEYQRFFESRMEKFDKTPVGGENYTQIKNRMTEFVYDLDAKHLGKNILIVGHNTPIWLMFAGVLGLEPQKAIELRYEARDFIKNSEVKELVFAPIPHNHNYELDLHRPYIDEIKFNCTCGGQMKRVPEVFDCWFESGSMPYAESHYPFENLKKFNPEPGFLRKSVGFPAEFIAEGLDQTRGWFYSMLVLSTGLFNTTSFKNVIVNGIVLTEDGQKMSKRLKNYPDPMDIVNKYSADALRYYLISSPVVKAEDLRFSEKGVDEIMKKILMRLDNVYSFYGMYSQNTSAPVKNFVPDSTNVLDRWLLSRLNKLITDVTSSLDKYELDKSVRPIADFVDDLSTWYLRRSRDRFKSDDVKDKTYAIETTRFVLEQLAKLIAPVMPFYAEELYQKVKAYDGEESVHLAKWPEIIKLGKEAENLLSEMQEVRDIVSVALELRSRANIKVRQPLAQLKVKVNLNEQYLELIKDEINVKEVVFDQVITESVVLDTVLTNELKEEGRFRELLRAIQELRKTEKLNPGDQAKLLVQTDDSGQKLIQKFNEEIKKIANLKSVSFGQVDGEAIVIENLEFKLKIVR